VENPRFPLQVLLQLLPLPLLPRQAHCQLASSCSSSAISSPVSFSLASSSWRQQENPRFPVRILQAHLQEILLLQFLLASPFSSPSSLASS